MRSGPAGFAEGEAEGLGAALTAAAAGLALASAAAGLGKVAFDFTADERGDWAFHCHLLYHMHAGMFNVVTVRPLEGDAA